MARRIDRIAATRGNTLPRRVNTRMAGTPGPVVASGIPHTCTDPPTVLVLASGRGERFRASGGASHKLQALLAGRPVLQHTLDVVRASGLPWHLESHPHPGMGDSIAAAVRATSAASGWLVLPGDLPLVRSGSLLSIAAGLARHDVVVPLFEGQRGHPVGFGRNCRATLTQLHGDQGAAAVVRALGATFVSVDDRGVVTDIDTVQDLARAEQLLAGKTY